MANRTLQFYGLAYGDVPVQLNAHINGQLVFTGAVPTVPGEPPLEPVYPMPVLFSIVESALYPTSYAGAYPMTISVATGYAIDVGEVFSNYIVDQNLPDQTQLTGSISGTTLTVESFTNDIPMVIGQSLFVEIDGVLTTVGIIVSGSGLTWTLDQSNTVSSTKMISYTIGTADNYLVNYNGIPANEDQTTDCRSSVTIDGIAETGLPPGTVGQKPWRINAGSTLGCNFNVSVGNE